MAKKTKLKPEDIIRRTESNRLVKFGDPFGEEVVDDLGDPQKEAELALKLQERAAELLER